VPALILLAGLSLRQRVLYSSGTLVTQQNKVDMKKWLVVHSLESYAENPRMIGFIGKMTLDGAPVMDENGQPGQPYFPG